jgi:alkanesulfonate monooxygenase SsuD/methylene tetrahydromethanopterin reductase-like flavin-dependent oxidoreductase (luciferase family)
MIDALVCSGSPDQIATALHAHLDAGADQVAISLLGPPSGKAAGYRALAASVGAGP